MSFSDYARLEKSLQVATVFFLLMSAFGWHTWALWIAAHIECPDLRAAVRPIGACMLARLAFRVTGSASCTEEQLKRDIRQNRESWEGRMVILAHATTLMSIFASWIWQLIAFLTLLLSFPSCLCVKSGWIAPTFVLIWAVYNAIVILPLFALARCWYRGELARAFSERMARFDSHRD